VTKLPREVGQIEGPHNYVDLALCPGTSREQMKCFHNLLFVFTLKVVVTHSFEKSVLTRITWHHIPRDILHSHSCENLKSLQDNKDDYTKQSDLYWYHNTETAATESGCKTYSYKGI
jgi:hypothetical protein